MLMYWAAMVFLRFDIDIERAVLFMTGGRDPSAQAHFRARELMSD